jgi:hypothetical protein
MARVNRGRRYTQVCFPLFNLLYIFSYSSFILQQKAGGGEGGQRRGGGRRGSDFPRDDVIAPSKKSTVTSSK